MPKFRVNALRVNVSHTVNKVFRRVHLQDSADTMLTPVLMQQDNSHPYQWVCLEGGSRLSMDTSNSIMLQLQLHGGLHSMPMPVNPQFAVKMQPMVCLHTQ